MRNRQFTVCQPAQSPRGRGRRGMTIIEVVVAASVLAVLLASSVQVLSTLSKHQRAAERRVLAIETTQAMIEQLSNRRWDDLTPQLADELTVPQRVRPFLPGAKIKATVVDEQEPVEAKRITVQLTWNSLGGQPAGPVRLTAWAFPDDSSPQE